MLEFKSNSKFWLILAVLALVVFSIGQEMNVRRASHPTDVEVRQALSHVAPDIDDYIRGSKNREIWTAMYSKGTVCDDCSFLSEYQRGPGFLTCPFVVHGHDERQGFDYWLVLATVKYRGYDDTHPVIQPMISYYYGSGQTGIIRYGGDDAGLGENDKAQLDTEREYFLSQRQY